MKWMKRTAMAIVASAALFVTASAPGMAAPVGQSAAVATGAAAQADGNVIDVREWRGRHGHGGHGWRHHRRHGGGGWWLPFAAAPFLYDDDYYYRGYRHRYYRHHYRHRYYRDW